MPHPPVPNVPPTSEMTSETRLQIVADDAVLLTMADAPSLAATERVVSAWRALVALAPPWLVHAQPAYTSLQVVHRADVAVDDVCAVLRALPTTGGLDQARTHELSVHYGGIWGPDLPDVADAVGLAIDDVIARHCGVAYRCACVGFTPGFPYLLGLDPALAVPRLTTPRPVVPAGSVAIAGGQAGVYPTATPGGWRLLGRVVDFDLKPDWVAPGDVVVFRRVP